MNTTHNNESANAEQTITGRCVQSCKKLLAGIEQTKNKIANEFQETLATHTQLFHLALNEAEALAFQTAYPQLVFPSLAVEKIQAVTAWQSRQQNLRRRQEVFAGAV
jgi:hypothetical protein